MIALFDGVFHDESFLNIEHEGYVLAKKTHTPVGVWVGGGLSSEQGFLVRVQESTGIALAMHALDQVRNERR